MLIRAFIPTDIQQCLVIFDSNAPKFFDHSEREYFEQWLLRQPALNESYLVNEVTDRGVIGCGGFYILPESKEVRFAWGMIHQDFHNQGFGTALYRHREKLIKQGFPNFTLSLGTSQHTFSFYQKMGMKVTQLIPSGYGPDIDRYDMEL